MIEALALVKILAGGIASVVLGFLWYHPVLFGNVWMRLSGITPEMVERGKRRAHLYALIALLAGGVSASAILFLQSSLGVSTFGAAGLLAFLLWAGFVAPALLGAVLWEQKSPILYLVNALYWLVALAAISVIVAF